jgi:hypothetical protein
MITFHPISQNGMLQNIGNYQKRVELQFVINNKQGTYHGAFSSLTGLLDVNLPALRIPKSIKNNG